MGATTSDLKIQIILYKFVPINFFVILHLHRKVIIIVVFFLLKGGPPWTFILWMNKNLIFFNPLESGTKKRGSQSNRCFPSLHREGIIFFRKFFL